MDLLVTVLITIVLITLYFLPYLVARYRGKVNAEAIGWLNLFAGWTFVGWVAAFVWAMTVDQNHVELKKNRR